MRWISVRLLVGLLVGGLVVLLRWPATRPYGIGALTACTLVLLLCYGLFRWAARKVGNSIAGTDRDFWRSDTDEELVRPSASHRRVDVSEFRCSFCGGEVFVYDVIDTDSERLGYTNPLCTAFRELSLTDFLMTTCRVGGLRTDRFRTWEFSKRRNHGEGQN